MFPGDKIIQCSLYTKKSHLLTMWSSIISNEWQMLILTTQPFSQQVFILWISRVIHFPSLTCKLAEYNEMWDYKYQCFLTHGKKRIKSYKIDFIFYGFYLPKIYHKKINVYSNCNGEAFLSRIVLILPRKQFYFLSGMFYCSKLESYR